MRRQYTLAKLGLNAALAHDAQCGILHIDAARAKQLNAVQINVLESAWDKVESIKETWLCSHSSMRWAIENSCHYVLDWNFNEDRSRIGKGNGPENVTRLRRFAVDVIKSFIKGKISVVEKMRQSHRSTRLVFDYLRMTKNSTRVSALASDLNKFTLPRPLSAFPG